MSALTDAEKRAIAASSSANPHAVAFLAACDERRVWVNPGVLARLLGRAGA